MKRNDDYTNLWVDNFDVDKALLYDRKFYTKFEKNIKHMQQLSVIRRYLKPGDAWLDAPVGSGRIMADIMHGRDNCFIFDYSTAFLEYSKKRLSLSDKNVFHGDISEITLDRKFDLITCNNMLFAFEDFEDILARLIDHLNSGGVIIFDVVNKALYEKVALNSKDPLRSNYGWNESDVQRFCMRYGCVTVDIILHDYFDSQHFLTWRRSGTYFQRKLKHFAWRVANRMYFKLRLFKIFEICENRRDSSLFDKLIVVLRKGPL